MALQGTLESFGISEIFQLISHQGKTGTLEIATEEGVSRIRFMKGKLVEAWDGKRAPSELIGAMLVRAALITPTQLEHALDVQRQSLRPLGDILLRMGALRASEFQEMLALQHRETLFRLLAKKRGQFSFRDEPVEIEHGVSVLMDTGALLMEGFRQIDEWPELLAAVPSEARVLVPLRDPEGEIGQEEARVLSLVDGVATVRDIVNRSRLGDFAGWKAVSKLLQDGIIAPVEPSRRPAVVRAHRGHRATRVVDAAVATVVLLLTIAVLLGNAAGTRATRLVGALSDAKAQAQGLFERTRVWNDRRPAVMPGGLKAR